jgi:hypothetical protein
MKLRGLQTAMQRAVAQVSHADTLVVSAFTPCRAANRLSRETLAFIAMRFAPLFRQQPPLVLRKYCSA